MLDQVRQRFENGLSLISEGRSPRYFPERCEFVTGADSRARWLH